MSICEKIFRGVAMVFGCGGGVGARWLSIGGFFKRSAEKKPSGDEAENKVRKPLAPQGCLKL